MSSTRKKIVVGLATIGALLSVVVVVVGCCTPQLAKWAFTPPTEFDPTKVPRAPDYAKDDAWLALPSTKDDADVALPSHPAAREPSVDVFYLHSTSSIAATWNAPYDDPEVRAASARGGTLIQASAFNGCCAVYAPEYRQASGTAYTERSPAGDQAIAVAYVDVVAAFQEFLRRTGDARPFIIASHSQGSVLATRLLREHVVSSSPSRAERLVAAYLIGAAVTARDIDVPLCSARDQTGCVVTFNARGPGHVRNALDFNSDGIDSPEADRLCVNPTLGVATGAAAPRSQHGGAIFFDTEVPKLLPAFAASQCSGGRLVVTELQELPKRDAMSAILMSVLGGENYHPIEYQLFYVDLREDAKRRAANMKR